MENTLVMWISCGYLINLDKFFPGILQAEEAYKTPDPGTVTVNVPVSQAAQARAKWQEAMNSEILIVRCREEVGEMHKNKLGSGGRGKCIKVCKQCLELGLK